MNVLVLVIRGLHLGYLGCYGSEWVSTPALDQLAAESIVFDQHIADCPDSDGARRAWRTGRYQFPGPDPTTDAQPEVDLLQSLTAHGVATILVSDAEPAAWTPLLTGWRHVIPVRREAETERREAILEAMRQGVELLAEQERGLLVVDISLLLPPWEVPDEFLEIYFRGERSDEEEEEEGESELSEPLTNPPTGPLDDPDDSLFLRIQGSYAAAVTYLDDGLGVLLEAMRETGLLDHFWLMVTSDHGQALGEHGIVGSYRPWLHDELIHLPLLVRPPDAAEAGRRVAALTQSVDLMPTLLDVFGLPIPPVHGRSLLPLLHANGAPLRGYACSGLRAGEAVEWALRTPEWAYLLPVHGAADDPARLPRLYVKPDDRWEVNNVLQHHLELGEHLEQVLRGFVEASRRPGLLEPPVLRDIEAGR